MLQLKEAVTFCVHVPTSVGNIEPKLNTSTVNVLFNNHNLWQHN